MVSTGIPVPVLNALVATVAVQLAPNPRWSVTWTVPRLALMVPPGAAEPRLALAGVVMDRAPATTATMTVHPGLVPAGQVLPGAVETTLLDRNLPPASGLLTVTEYPMVAICPGVRSPVQVRTGLV